MVINLDRFVTSSMSVFFIEKHSAITVLNALERGGRYVVLGDDPEQPRHDRGTPSPAVLV